MLLKQCVEPSPALPRTLREQMVLIRVLETKLQALCNAGQLGADLHFSTGQEAIPVGVCAALRETDYVATHHRTIAHAVAKGVPLRPLIAELFGKATGLCGGRSGEMHMSYLPKRFMFSFQLVGTCIPVSAGMAWAVKNYLKTDDIVVVFHGDAATANGQWHEGVNLAAVQQLPLLLVCENNFLAGNVRPDDYLPSSSIFNPFSLEQRADAYNLARSTVDGNDVEAVRDTATRAVDYVRRRSQPFLLVCDTTRLGRHKQGQGDLRSPEEKVELALRDPLRDMTDEERQPIEDAIDELIKGVQVDPEPLFPQEEY